MPSDIVRIVRVIEYTGDRERVEQTIAESLHGTTKLGRGLTIRTATIGEFPEILETDQQEETQNDNQ